jgi:WD40 repeat protein
MEYAIHFLNTRSRGRVNVSSICATILTFYRSSKNKDQLIKTFEEHEDSVYSIAWGTSGWSFASLSYDGRVVINDVPKEYSDFF